jgi:hypothetical protein
MTAAPGERQSVLLLSPAGDHGSATSEAELVASLDRLDIPLRVVETGRGRGPLGGGALGAPFTFLAARRAIRRALAEEDPAAVISIDSTAALLLPRRRLRASGIPVAVRIDRSAEGPRMRRLLERWALRRADAALTSGPACTESAGRFAHRALEVPVPLPIRPPNGSPRGVRPPIAWVEPPFESGLDCVCQAWLELERRRHAPQPIRLVGLDAEQGRRYLRRLKVHEPRGAIWIGSVPKERYLELLPDAAAFVAASRSEAYAVAQLEALAAGVPLVTGAAPGSHEAERIARKLAPELVRATHDPRGLAAAADAALSLDPAARADYARRAAELLAPFSCERADAALRDALTELREAPSAAGA